MNVYRITRVPYANMLLASGGAARWNARGKFAIYTAESTTLAILENIVHRSRGNLNDSVVVVSIYIPESVFIADVRIDALPENWAEFSNYEKCQSFGNNWLASNFSAVLRVPSAIIPTASNYLLNPEHPDFFNISILRTEPFSYDSRIKG